MSLCILSKVWLNVAADARRKILSCQSRAPGAEPLTPRIATTCKQDRLGLVSNGSFCLGIQLLPFVDTSEIEAKSQQK